MFTSSIDKQQQIAIEMKETNTQVDLDLYTKKTMPIIIIRYVNSALSFLIYIQSVYNAK